MGRTVDELLAAMATLADELATVDPASLSDDELHAFVTGCQRQRARFEVTTAPAVAAWHARKTWAADGSRSAAHRLAREVNCSVRSAKQHIERARHLGAMPATRAAVLDGRLSMDHVDLLGRANQADRAALFAEDEQLLVDECATLTFRDAYALVKYWIQRADAAAAEREGARIDDAAHLSVSATLDGTVVVDGVLEPIGGAIVQGELRRIERELHLADQRDGVDRSAAQRRAAALVEMARRSAGLPADAKRPRVVLSVLLGDDTFRTLCELSTGAIVTPGQVSKWIDDAVLETILFDGPSTVISVSKRRTFIGALRRAIEVRDRRCQHPSGCGVSADRCDVDHIVPAAEDGPTSQFNGRLECPTHNRHADKHDTAAEPLPERPVDRLDEMRARIRWRYRHLYADNENDDDENNENDDDRNDAA